MCFVNVWTAQENIKAIFGDNIRKTDRKFSLTNFI